MLIVPRQRRNADTTDKRADGSPDAFILQDLSRKVELYERMLSAIEDFTYIFDLQGRFQYINQRLLDLWGMTAAEATGKSFFELPYPKELAAQLQQEIQQVIATGEPFKGRTSYLSPTGHEGVYEYIFSPVFNEIGAVEAVAGTTRDITQRVRAEFTQARLAAIVESSDDAIVSKDLNGIIQTWNAGARRLFGYTAQEVIGKPINILIPDDRSDEEPEILQRIRRGDRIEHYETIRRRKDGTLVNVSLSVSPIIDDQGRVTGASKIARNITERQALLEREKNAHRQASEANRAKDIFLAMLSHEIRTPLQAIVGWTNVLDPDTSDRQELREGLEVIRRSAEAQSRLIEDLLDYSRIISGKLELKKSPSDLKPIVQGAVDLMRPAADARGIKLVTRLPSNAVISDCDPHRMQQVVWNLIANAIKFTPASNQKPGATISITLELDPENPAMAKIVVRDTGRGIDASLLPYIFDRFRQGQDGASPEHGGMGLGLSIVRHIAQLHGGSATAASDGPGHGSTFTVRLPIQTAQ